MKPLSPCAWHIVSTQYMFRKERERGPGQSSCVALVVIHFLLWRPEQYERVGEGPPHTGMPGLWLELPEGEMASRPPSSGRGHWGKHRLPSTRMR